MLDVLSGDLTTANSSVMYQYLPLSAFLIFSEANRRPLFLVITFTDYGQSRVRDEAPCGPVLTLNTATVLR